MTSAYHPKVMGWTKDLIKLTAATIAADWTCSASLAHILPDVWEECSLHVEFNLAADDEG